MKISVVMPALNEADFIREAIFSVVNQCPDAQVIVVDGGSSDGTVEIASPLGTVLMGERGRATQMNTGAARAEGDVLLFLQADSSLHPGAIAAMCECLQDKTIAGGTFCLKFDSNRFLLKIIASFTRLPFRFFHYGDQGIFVRRSVFEAMGGFTNIPLMEDIEFLTRLRKSGRVALVRLPVTTSARRYIQNGVVSQQLLDCFLVAAYLLGVKAETLSRWYYSNKNRSGKLPGGAKEMSSAFLANQIKGDDTNGVL